MNFKITVLRKMFNKDYADQYCAEGISLCPVFDEGQEFYTSFDEGKPEGFCTWAWDDLFKYIALFSAGGNMGDSFHYMKSNNTVVACCTDGIRPVIFRIEVI